MRVVCTLHTLLDTHTWCESCVSERVSVCTYHGQVQHAGCVHGHGGEQCADHVAHDGHAGVVGPEHVVAVHLWMGKRCCFMSLLLFKWPKCLMRRPVA